jgi:RNA polymerase sigma factor (sigma-70 family)
MRRLGEVRLRERREALILGNLPLVRHIAHSIRGMFDTRVPFEDLVQAGCVGLVEAAGRWRVSSGVYFTFYAYRRIKGAIIDAYKRQRFSEETYDSLDAWVETLETAGADGWACGATKFRAIHDPAPDLDEQVWETQRQRAARSRLALLPAAERAVVHSALGGQSADEIAEEAGKNPAHIRRILRRAARLPVVYAIERYAMARLESASA